MKAIRNALCLSLVGFAASISLGQTDLLPDIYVEPSYLYDNEITVEGGVRYLRLSNGTANIGLGKLYLRGGTINGDGTRDVHQRIYREDGSSWERLAGKFTHHDDHGHMHFDDWSVYRLREIVGDDGVGDIVAEGFKTSFCIIDLAVYDSSLPNFNPSGEFRSCNSTIQGLSVGWVDIYSKGLSGQVIPIDGVPDGEYWLESVVDPDDHVLESDETNNVSRVRVTIDDNGGGGGDIPPDAYEPNESRSEVAGRSEGSPNSPNLGPCNPQLVIEDLTIDDNGDEDYFRFYMNSTGTSSDFVRVEFVHSQGDVDMELYNASGSRLAISNGVSNSETISLNGFGEGYYYVRVYGYSGDTCPAYDLTIDPPANQAPSIEVLTPPLGDTRIEHGDESYRTEWSFSDPENNDAWVTVYANTVPGLDGNEILLPTSVNTPADLGFYIVNSAYLELDTYYIIAEISDGGSTGVGVSPGTLTLVDSCGGDFNSDGTVNTQDVLDFLNAFADADNSADINEDGTVDTQDVLDFLNLWVVGC